MIGLCSSLKWTVPELFSHLGRDHRFKQVSVLLFWSTSEFDFCVHTHPKEPHQGGNEPKSDSSELNKAGVKSPLHVLNYKEHFEDFIDSVDYIHHQH